MPECKRPSALRGPASLALLGILMLTLTACPGRKLADDPGLFTEDFGTGIRLGQALTDAQDAARQAKEWEVWLLSRDELNVRNPFLDRPEGKDLLVAIYLPLPDVGESAVQAGDLEVINELRVYLAPAEDSSLRFRGEYLAMYSKSQMIELLGDPSTPVSEGHDGQVHLEYFFRLPDEPGKALELISSHYLPERSCLSLSLALIDDPS